MKYINLKKIFREKTHEQKLDKLKKKTELEQAKAELERAKAAKRKFLNKGRKGPRTVHTNKGSYTPGLLDMMIGEGLREAQKKKQKKKTKPKSDYPDMMKGW